MRLYRADWENADGDVFYEWFGTQALIAAHCKKVRGEGFTVTRAKAIDMPDRKEELIAYLNNPDDPEKQGIEF